MPDTITPPATHKVVGGVGMVISATGRFGWMHQAGTCVGSSGVANELPAGAAGWNSGGAPADPVKVESPVVLGCTGLAQLAVSVEGYPGVDGWAIGAGAFGFTRDRDKVSFPSACGPLPIDNIYTYQPGFPRTGRVIGYKSGEGDWVAKHGQIDVHLTRACWVSNYVRMAFGFGIEGFWHDQNKTLALIGKDFQAPVLGTPGLISTPYEFHLLQNMKYFEETGFTLWGIGPAASFRADFHMADWVSLYSSVRSAFFLSYCQRSGREARIEEDSPPPPHHIRIEASQKNDRGGDRFRFVPYQEMELGVSFGAWFSDNSIHLRVEVGLIGQRWADLSQYPDSSSTSCFYGDLTFGGVSVRGGISF